MWYLPAVDELHGNCELESIIQQSLCSLSIITVHLQVSNGSENNYTNLPMLGKDPFIGLGCLGKQGSYSVARLLLSVSSPL